MSSRLVALALVAMLVALQAQLWLGRGSLPDNARMRALLEAQLRDNAAAAQLNNQRAAEVRDLKEGLEIVEEKARSELGMVKPNEIFVQIAK